MARRLYWGFALILFIVGGYVWKVQNTGQQSIETYANDVVSASSHNDVLIVVGDTPIKVEDIDWEYKLHTAGLIGMPDMTSIPNLGKSIEQELSPLKQSILGDLVERKVLFKFVQQDKSFDMSDPSLVTACLTEWQDTLKKSPDVFPEAHDQERLKSRLCEKALIMHYAEQQIWSKIKIEDPEIREYYKNHAPEFKKSKRIVLRQILLATEQEARKVRRDVTKANFSALAKEHSIAQEGATGGLLPAFSKGEFPSVFDQAFNMQVGQISDILKSDYGFHIVMVEKKIPEVDLSLAEATPQIRQTMMKKKRSDEYQKWIDTALNSIAVSTSEREL